MIYDFSDISHLPNGVPRRVSFPWIYHRVWDLLTSEEEFSISLSFESRRYVRRIKAYVRQLVWDYMIEEDLFQDRNEIALKVDKNYAEFFYGRHVIRCYRLVYRHGIQQDVFFRLGGETPSYLKEVTPTIFDFIAGIAKYPG